MRSIRSRLKNKNQRNLYPSPLFSLSDFYLPDNIKEVFNFCKRLAMTNHIVSSVLHKLAEAPITELEYDHENESVRKRYSHHFEEDLNIREVLLEQIMDLVTYSNSFASYEVPVTRYLVSPAVHEDVRSKLKWAERDGLPKKERERRRAQFDGWYNEQAGVGRRKKGIINRFRIETIDWTLHGGRHFSGECPVTGKHVKFERVDRHYASPSNVSIKRWDPNRITIHHNDLTGKSKYFYKMKNSTRKLIEKGDRDMYNEVPWAYIEAALDKRNVRIRNENLYHLSNVKISGAFPGWGVPRLFSAFKLIFYYLTLLKANESIAVGKIHDLNILFPSSSGMGQMAGVDPSSATSGAKFNRHIAGILKRHQKDPNFVGVAPFPIGSVSLFGQGRMQLVSQELEPITRAITTTMGLPYDLLYGGGAYTGQAVANRLFNAQNGLHRNRFNEMLGFFVNRTSAALGRKNYPNNAEVKLKAPQGPDDVQKNQTIVNLGMNQVASATSTLKAVGLDWEAEKKNLIEEAKDRAMIRKIQAMAEAKAQGEQQEIMQRTQARLERQQMQRQQRMQQEQMAAAQPGGMAPGAGQPGAPQPGGPQPGAPQGGPQQGGPQQGAAPQGGAPQGAAPTVQEQAMQLVQFVQQFPDRADQALQIAQADFPEVYQMAVAMLEEGAQPGDVPAANMPTLDPSMQDIPPGAQDGRGAQDQNALAPGGGGASGPALSRQQPEQLPPRRL